MSQKDVLRPGHVCIRVLDLEEAIVHYRDRMGLIVTEQEGERAFLKA